MSMQLRHINRLGSMLSDPSIHNREGISRFIDVVKSMPGALGKDPFELYHHFSDGIYTREIHIPAGHIVCGKIHKKQSTVQLLKGSLIVADETGSKTLNAPCQFVSDGGLQRVAFTFDDVVWIDIHATDESTVDAAEKELFANDYSELEYYNMCKSIGYTEVEVYAISHDERDVIHDKQAGVSVGKSNIEGMGVFAEKGFKSGDEIGVALIGNRRTLLGRYTNHSASPNAERRDRDGMMTFSATCPIFSGDEITLNYEQVINQ